MNDILNRIFGTDDFMPHGMCYLWRPDVLTLHVVADALIVIAYFSIPFSLVYFVRKRKNLDFHWMFLCFALFIVACGATHAMEIVTIWQPLYWLSGGVKAITALASVPTAVLLIKLMPEALSLPSPSDLRTINTELRRQVAERERAEREVRRMNEELESRVAERTRQLEDMNESLRREIEERHRAEQTLRTNQQLLRAVIDNSAALISVKDTQGRYLLANRRFEQLFGAANEGTIGKTDRDLFDPEAADRYRYLDQRVLAGTETVQAEQVAMLPDGPHTYISVKSPLRGQDGQPYAICGISTDITESKEAERRQRQQLSRLELLNRITRAIADRQDLTSILQVVLQRLEDDLPIDFACVCAYDAAKSSLTIIDIGAKSRSTAQQLQLNEQTRFAVGNSEFARCVKGQLVHGVEGAKSTAEMPLDLARGGLHSFVLVPLPEEHDAFGVLLVARSDTQGFAKDEREFLRQLCEHVSLAIKQTRMYAALQQAYDDLRQSQRALLQQERLRALGEMASGIAHDINNAISPIALYAESLRERESLSVPGRKQLATMQRAIEDVANTVSRLREF